MLSKQFWLDALERGVSTAAQAVVLAVTGDAFNVLNADWKTLGGAAAGGFALAILKALAASRVGSPDSASFDPQG